MELNVSQLLLEPSGSSRQYKLDEVIDLVENFGGVRISGTVNLLRTNKSIWVSASFDSTLDCECGRCLAHYDHPIHLVVEEEYIPTRNPNTGARVIPPVDHSDLCLIDESHILDLTGIVREYATMAAPMKPLCDQQCPGLCADCGADFNQTQCGCEAPVDPRWGPLLRLITQTSELNPSRN